MAKRKPPPAAPIPGPAGYNRMATAPSWAAMRVLRMTEQPSVLDKMDLPALIRLLREQAQVVNGGNLEQAEGMLINQAVALQSLVARLVELGMSAGSVATVRGSHAIGAAGAGPVRQHAAGAERVQESPSGVRQTSKHRQSAAGEQRHPTPRGLARAGSRSCANPTFRGQSS
jgi:hypothetical protein